MGLRGPGATRKRKPHDAEKPKRKRRLPWKKQGLSLAGQVIAFCEFLPVTRGRRRGKKMKLLESQKEFIRGCFPRNRSVSLAILSEPKGNGKTGLVAAICLAGLVGPLSEERGAVFSASISRGKAAEIFKEMRAIIVRVPEFKERINIVDFHKTMHVYVEGDGFDSTFEALSADFRAAQGLSPTLWAYDEFGEAPDGRLLEVLLESEGKRDKTLGIVLSTQAADDDHPFSKLIDDARTGADRSTYLQIHEAPPEADAFSDETLKLANPAYGHFLDLDAIIKSRDRARRIPSMEASFRRLRLNQRIDSQGEERIISGAVWRQCEADVSRASLKRRRCYGALDMSKKDDLTAFVLVFPSDGKEPTYDVLAWFWTPQEVLETRQPAEQDRFREWIKAGWIKSIPGPIVRTHTVAADILELTKEFDIRVIASDYYRVEDVKADLADADIGLPVESFRQGPSKQMAPAIEYFQELAISKRLRHGGNATLTASVVNAILRIDVAGNPAIEKPKSNRRGPVRVDGCVSLVMALGMARRFQEEPKVDISSWIKNPIVVNI